MGRGHLRIYLGAAPGVGKTYAMLNEGRRRAERGHDVVVGIVETHGRAHTAAQLEGLEVVPRRKVSYRGTTLEELDVDAVLARAPAQVLVDELAHTNAPGSRHAKRWQDIEELLDAGIDVYTALNVQHLDSLNDIVGGIIGIRVRETVPDRIFDSATDVVLVDLPPDDLLARLNAGKVYLPISIERARQNFFRRGNLIALRELALRRVADRVNADVRTYRVSNAIRTVWPTRECLLVCVQADRSQEKLVREGARLAEVGRYDDALWRELAELGHAAATSLAGDSLVHGDLRPDNMLITPAGQARFVDWNWVARGPGWCDFVGLLPLMAHHGLDVDAMVDGSPLLAGVEADAVDSFLAIIVGYMVDSCTKPAFPSSLVAVRAHQAQMARTFLAWLARRRGW